MSLNRIFRSLKYTATATCRQICNAIPQQKKRPCLNHTTTKLEVNVVFMYRCLVVDLLFWHLCCSLPAIGLMLGLSMAGVDRTLTAIGQCPFVWTIVKKLARELCSLCRKTSYLLQSISQCLMNIISTSATFSDEEDAFMQCHTF